VYSHQANQVLSYKTDWWGGRDATLDLVVILLSFETQNWYGIHIVEYYTQKKSIMLHAFCISKYKIIFHCERIKDIGYKYTF